MTAIPQLVTDALGACRDRTPCQDQEVCHQHRVAAIAETLRNASALAIAAAFALPEHVVEYIAAHRRPDGSWLL